jgi:hypothetical protein
MLSLMMKDDNKEKWEHSNVPFSFFRMMIGDVNKYES